MKNNTKQIFKFTVNNEEVMIPKFVITKIDNFNYVLGIENTPTEKQNKLNQRFKKHSTFTIKEHILHINTGKQLFIFNLNPYLKYLPTTDFNLYIAFVSEQGIIEEGDYVSFNLKLPPL